MDTIGSNTRLPMTSQRIGVTTLFFFFENIKNPFLLLRPEHLYYAICMLQHYTTFIHNMQ